MTRGSTGSVCGSWQLSGNWWGGWIEEVPGINCQESTREQLIESLRITLREALEFNRRDALEAAGEGFDEESIAL